MIICSCNVLSDHEVRTAMVADVPPRTIGQLYRCLGCDARCGCCVRSIKRIMREAVGAGDGHGAERGELIRRLAVVPAP